MVEIYRLLLTNSELHLSLIYISTTDKIIYGQECKIMRILTSVKLY